jgi:hypothetical protein
MMGGHVFTSNKVSCMSALTLVHANDHAAVAHLPVCDAHGTMLCDEHGISFALHALYHGHRTLAEAISARCRHVDPFTAAALNRIDDLDWRLQHTPACVHEFSSDGFQMLGLACFFGAVASAQRCLDAGADVNQASHNDFIVAPIHSATAANDETLVRLLLSAGADVNARQSGNFVALHTAAQHGNRAICALLIAAGADISAQTHDGHTPLFYAQQGHHTDLYPLLTPTT